MQTATKIGDHAACTTYRQADNYVHIDGINEALAQNGLPNPRNVNYANFDDVPSMLAAELNAVLPAHQQWNPKAAKMFLNNNAVPRMNLARLQAIDPAGEVLGWFTRIQHMLQ